MYRDLRTQVNALVKAAQQEHDQDSLIYNLAFAISHTLADIELGVGEARDGQES